MRTKGRVASGQRGRRRATGLEESTPLFLRKLVEWLGLGRADNDQPRKPLVITEPIIIRDGDSVVAATPSDEPEMTLLYELDYGDGPIGRQLVSFDFNNDDYKTQIAPCRTFSTKEEAEARHHDEEWDGQTTE